MATYKVLQDIEAEDKFVGPLTLKQFIFAAVASVSAYVSFILLSKGLWVLALPIFPVIFVTGFLAFPWGRDQPTEVWLLAKLRFLLKPRKRIWNQTGIQELVTITVPKKIEQHLTDNLSKSEVKSRLKALAETIDSRGWAVKNVNVNLFAQPGYVLESNDSDRLINPSALPNRTPATDVQAADDILDEQNNPTAQNLTQMVSQSEQTHRQATLQKMQQVREKQQEPKTDKEAPPNFWFMDQPAKPAPIPNGFATFSSQTVTPGAQDDQGTTPKKLEKLSPEEQALLKKLHEDAEKPSSYGHMKVIEPVGKHKKTTAKKKAPKPEPTMTQTPDPDILDLAINNNRDVASLAREANAKHPNEPPDEVVISLH